MNRFVVFKWMWGVVLIVPCLLAGCADQSEIAPPEIAYGVSPCVYCGMIVSEDQFACGAVVRTSDGRIESHAFDDFNCMLDYAPANGGEIAQLYVHDHDTRAWTEAESAWYVHSAALHTPMASGLAAFIDKPAADALAASITGEVLDFDGVRERHALGQLSLLWLNEQGE